MMIETTRADTNISPLSQSYENTDLDVHDREEKLYAKVFDPSEFEGKTKEDLVFLIVTIFFVVYLALFMEDKLGLKIWVKI
jgi:hypothetical protein